MLKLFFSLLVVISFAKTTRGQELRTVYTEDDAKKFIEKNPALNPEFITVNSGDTSAAAVAILKRRKGEFFTSGKFSYKVIDEKVETRWRVSYIFLDKFKVDKTQLETIKKAVADGLKEGKTIASMSDTYTMDHNTTKGDTGFFGEGMMTPEFEEAVKMHRTGELFFVDIPERDWYYIIQKTHDDQKVKEMRLLRAKK